MKFDVIKTIIAQDKSDKLVQAKCGNDGLLKLSKEEYGLLILDMSLPINVYSKDTNML